MAGFELKGDEKRKMKNENTEYFYYAFLEWVAKFATNFFEWNWGELKKTENFVETWVEILKFQDLGETVNCVEVWGEFGFNFEMIFVLFRFEGETDNCVEIWHQI